MRRVNHSFHRLTSYNPWQILSAGYNGFPPGTPNKDENWRKGKKDDLVVHAEANTVLLAGQADLEGSIAFVTMYPCRECAKMLIAVSDVENIRITCYSYRNLCETGPISERICILKPVSYGWLSENFECCRHFMH